MTRVIPIEEVVKAETKHQTVFFHLDLTWDKALALGERLDQTLAEVGGWAKFIGKHGGRSELDLPTSCTFELYPKRLAAKAWRIVALGSRR